MEISDSYVILFDRLNEYMNMSYESATYSGEFGPNTELFAQWKASKNKRDISPSSVCLAFRGKRE